MAAAGQVTALGCGRTGWCALAGQAEKPGDEGRGQPFVASEHSGTWRRAQAVPGLAALTRGWTADVAAVSCDPQDTCTAGGDYRDHAVHSDEPYVVTDRAGRWGRARPISGSASLGDSYLTVLSCPEPGDCSAAGTEGDNDTGTPVGMFTATETGGTWHAAARLRGAIRLPYPVDTEIVTALTCTAPGQCTALGAYATDGDSSDSEPVDGPLFEAVQAHGAWSAIHAIRGLPSGAVTWATSVSCASAGNCAAGGYWFTNASEYTMSSNHAFVAIETHGTWRAEHVPGVSALHSTDSVVQAVSCLPRRSVAGCGAVGDFQVRVHHVFTTLRG